MDWWEEAGLTSRLLLGAVPLRRWRAWAAHTGVLRAKRDAFVEVKQRNLE